jgi:chromosome segregation ATPase
VENNTQQYILENEKMIFENQNFQQELLLSKREIEKSSQNIIKLESINKRFEQDIRGHITKLNEFENSIRNKISTSLSNSIKFSDYNVKLKDLGLRSHLTSTALDELLVQFSNQIESHISGISESLDSVLSDLQVCTHKLQAIERSNRENEKKWFDERGIFINQINSLDKLFQDEQDRVALLMTDNNKCMKDIEKLEYKLQEFVTNNSYLENELKISSTNIQELRSTLHQAQDLCSELSEKLKILQSENSNQSITIRDLNEKIDKIRNNEGNLMLDMEKSFTTMKRLQAEKEALSNVKSSLEVELGRVHRELDSMRHARLEPSDDSRASYEIEKLLATICTTLDQVETYIYDNKFQSISNFSTVLKGQALQGSQSLTNRVDSVMKRVYDWKTWSRDENRKKREVEEKNALLNQQLLSARNEIEESKKRLSLLIQNSTDIDSNSKDTLRLVSQLENDVSHYKNELLKIRSELTSQQMLNDDDKKTIESLYNDNKSKEDRITFLHQQIEELKHLHDKLLVELNGHVQKLNQSELQIQQDAQQIKLLKSNNEKLTATLETVQKTCELEYSNRTVVEQKLLMIESNIDHNYKIQKLELEGQLKLTKDKLNITEEKVQKLDTQNNDLLQTIQTLKKQLSVNDAKVIELEHDKQVMKKMMNDMQSEISKRNQIMESERLLKLKSDTMVSTLSTYNTTKSAQNQSFIQLLETIEGKLDMDENEQINLKQQIHKLKVSIHEKDSSHMNDKKRIERLENEVLILQQKFQKATQEVSAANNRATSLRIEGRKSRAIIQQSTSKIMDVVSFVRSVVKVTGPLKSLESNPAPSSSDIINPISGDIEHISSESSLGLVEALGVYDLLSATEGLQDVLNWLRNSPHERLELQSMVRRLENEKHALEKDNSSLKLKYEDMIKVLKEENNNQNLLITELKKGNPISIGSVDFEMRINMLEKALNNEKSENFKLVEKLSQITEENKTMNKQLLSLTEDINNSKIHYKSNNVNILLLL